MANPLAIGLVDRVVAADAVLDTALEWAARIPAAPGSVIEVRPNLLPPG